MVEEENEINVDAVLEHVGSFGKYQFLLLVLFSFINLISGFHYFGQTFINVIPEYHCKNFDENATNSQCTIKNNQTGETFYCDSWVYSNDNVMGFAGIIEELNWVCSEDWKPALGQSLFFIGSVIGSLTFGILADLIGRLHVLVIANMFALIGNGVTVLSRNIITFAASRFLAGFATDSNFVMMYIIVLEYMKPSMRTFGLNVCIGVFYCISCVVIPWIAVFLGNWKSLMIFVAAPHILVLGFYLIVPESAQWLISKGKVDRAIKSFKRVAWINGKVVDEKVFDVLRQISQKQAVQTKTVGGQSFLALFRTKNLRRKSLILVFKSMVLVLCYDAIHRNVNGFNYSPFIIFSITSTAILPAGLFILAVQDRIGRKALASSSLLTGGLFLMLSGYLRATTTNPSSLFLLSLGIIARLCVNVAYNSGTQYCFELIPTVVRAQGVAFMHVVGYAASFFSPQILYLGNNWKPAPDVLLGVLMVTGAIVCLFLPETLNKMLPVSLEDGEKFGEGERPLEFAFCNRRTESMLNLFNRSRIYTVSE